MKVSVISLVSLAFCLAKASATAWAMVLASAVSLDSLLEVVAFLSQVLSLFPITFTKNVLKTAFNGF